MTLKMLAVLAIYSPLLGFLLALGINKLLPDQISQWLTCGLMGIALLCSGSLFPKFWAMPGKVVTFPLVTWLQVGDFTARWGIRLDSLTIIMIITVNLVSLLVHIYSIGYMSNDKSIPRFMSYLSLFTWTMLMLVSAPNLLQLYFGWEGVGLSSYLLIGFWYSRPAANLAALKAFIINRIGDMALLLAIAGTFYLFQTLDLQELFQNMQAEKRPSLSLGYLIIDGLNALGLLFFLGAMAKSAQIGLHTWLADAMEGPTPVSALIHAATMVTAGVFLVVRLSPLYELTPGVQTIMCLVGITTAFYAASVALTQNDIKRIIAYSTCSQLGYMFVAAACSAYKTAIFHLVTHAFFKALLFLSAGSVIHALSDEQDIRKMGGIYKQIPLTYTFSWIGSLSLAGIPFFSGFYSKDLILDAAFLSHNPCGKIAYVGGVIVAGLTAFYSWRALLLTFHGKVHLEEAVMARIHEAPLSMQIPSAILALGAIFIGISCSNFFADPFLKGQGLNFWLKEAGLICAVLGILLAYYLYWLVPEKANTLANRYPLLYRFSLRKWYFDEIFAKAFIMPSLILGTVFWQIVDNQIINHFGPNGVARTARIIARFISILQSGLIYDYALALVTGLVLMMSWYLLQSSFC